MREKGEALTETLIQRIQSPKVMDEALLRLKGEDVPELASLSNPVACLSVNLECERIKDTDLYAISFTSKNPDAAAAVVNAVVDSYLWTLEREDSRRVRRHIELLEKELTELRERVGRSAVLSVEVEPSQSLKDAAGPLLDLREKLIIAEADKVVVEVEIHVLEEAADEEQREGADTQPATDFGERAAATTMERNRELTYTRGQLSNADSLLSSLRQEYEELVSELGKESPHPELERLRAELAVKEGVCERIDERILMLETEQRAPSRVELLRRAERPTEPVKGYPHLTTAMAALAGFCLPFFGLVLLRLSTHSVLP
jgi:uncharacterized protein involved in exopolysaccharide biosynthesis